jgi:signal transduction histidine kinase
MADNTENKKDTNWLALDWLVSNLRWLWLFFAAVFILAESQLSATPSSYYRELLILMGTGVVLNAVYAGLLWAKLFPSSLAVATIILDIVFAVVLLILMNKHAQFLLPLMIFPAIIAGIRWNTEAGLLVALPIVISYATPLVPILSTDIDRTELITALLTLGVNALTIFLAGVLPGFLTRRRVEIAQHANKTELEHLRLANERGKIIFEMALTLSSTLNYRKVLRAVVDSAYSAMVGMTENEENGSSTVAVVLLFDDTGKLRVVAERNMKGEGQGRRISGRGGLIGRTINTAEATITHAARKDQGLTSLARECRSAICAPLRAGFDTFGVILFCSTQPRFYNKDHKTLLTTFCSQAIIPLQNAQLFDDVRREQQRILEKEAEARSKLARDLHDGPTQSIAAIVMRLNFIKMVVQKGDLEKAYDELVKVEEIAQRTTQEIRTMLFTMRPVILETQGLMPALDQYAQRLNDNESFRVSIIDRGYNGQLSQEAEGVVFAIVEEAVSNAKKHAQASDIRIRLMVRNESLFVEVRDDGTGFDVEQTQSTYDLRTSLGLINMEERAKLVGGHCTIESAPGQGTAIGIEIPFRRPMDII